MVFDTWESYFYAETYDPSTGQGTLRNLFDERDPVLLRELEYSETIQRQRESKIFSSFSDVRTGEIDRYLADVHRLVEGTSWMRLDRGGFARAGAEVFAYLNQAHPFRASSGRTSKVFMEHVAEQSCFTLDFGQVSPEVWNQASMLSGPDLRRYEPVSDSLVSVFVAIA
ncbi:Fic family protein [Actinomyces ruminis]|uniref:Cell filamentation protein Fic n=1 Tax=Actinomyces ruminis TaxID=1937003 RepID=A0ABX4MB27_9ACTO|nr:Fic family protein [Actinomyces ruminis]PHP52667.1 cell filamentation protein Fic [Actinomyces ruminis]